MKAKVRIVRSTYGGWSVEVEGDGNRVINSWGIVDLRAAQDSMEFVAVALEMCGATVTRGRFPACAAVSRG